MINDIILDLLYAIQIILIYAIAMSSIYAILGMYFHLKLDHELKLHKKLLELGEKGT